jgi:hypothetical protein
MRFVRCVPYLVLVAYFIAIVVLQPSDRFVPPQYIGDDYPLQGGWARFVFDDGDIAAWVLRAENANRGRKAGEPKEPQPDFPDEKLGFKAFEDKVANPPPLMERYFLEYPAAALWFFRLGTIGSGRPSSSESVSPGILDANQFNILYYEPRNDVEARLWKSWRRAQIAYAAMLFAVLAALMWITERGIGADGRGRGSAWLFLLPAFLYFTPCRFDIIPAAFVVFAIAATDRKRILPGAFLLGCAVALKMYPLVVAPLILRYAARSWKDAILWCAVFAVPIVGSYGSIVATDGVEAAVAPMKFQLQREPEINWVLDGRFWPKDWHSVIPEGSDKRVATTKNARQAILLLGVVAMCVYRPRDVESLLRRCAVAVTAFVCLQFFFSPQWWQWIAVLLIPLVRRHLWLIPFIILGDLAVFGMFPCTFELGGDEDVDVKEFVIYARGIVWFAIAILMMVMEVRYRKRGGAGY